MINKRTTVRMRVFEHTYTWHAHKHIHTYTHMNEKAHLFKFGQNVYTPRPLPFCHAIDNSSATEAAG